METEREFLSERGCASLYSESVGDYTLPDYNTDVKRVLMTRAEAVSAGCFVNGDDLAMTGVVNYEVVYLDADNDLTSCSFSTDYDMAVKCHGERCVGSDVTTRVSTYSVRLTGPRRFSVKAQLVSDVNITESDSISVLGTAFDVGEPEVRSKKAPVAYRIYSAPQEREYAEQLASLDGVIADDLTVLYSDVLPSVNAEYADGGVQLNGNLTVRSLVMREGELPELYSKDIPISENIALEGVSADMDITPDVRITSLKVTAEPTEDGVSLVANLIAEYSASAVGNKEIPVILDCYLTERGVSNDYEDFVYTEHLGCGRVDEVVEVSLSRTEVGAENIRDFIIPTATLKTEEVTPTSEGAKIKGIIRFSGVACEINEAGELGFTGVKYDAPFEKNVKFGCHMPENTRLVCKGSVTSPSLIATPDAVELCARLDLTVSASATGRVTRLSSSVADDEPFADRGSVVTVYYPEGRETLFDVGRKFHTKAIDIAADNSLTEEVFSAEGSGLSDLGVKKLVIR